VKTLSHKQLEARKAQAVRFVRDVLGDDDKADDIEDESLEDYAEHRHIKLANPKGATHMAAPTRQELLDRIEELETENEGLQSQLDEIRDIIGDDDEDEDNDTDEGEDDDQGED
jgi:vacuolar-type H+-ATPase subunit I/STV1